MTVPGFASHTLRSRDLTIAEQVALWLVRRAYAAGAHATERTARQVFGELNLRTALAALDELVSALHASPLDVPLVHPLRDAALSVCEFDLLTAIATAQECGRVTGVVQRWGWQAAHDVDRVDACIAALGQRLGEADHLLPRSAARPILAAHEAVEVEQLDTRERMLVEGIRCWVANHAAQRDALAPMTTGFASLHLEPAAAPLHAILVRTCSSAIRSVDVRCQSCPLLGSDEARIVHAISASQRRYEDVSFELLSSWLAPAVVRHMLAAVDGVGYALAKATHRLPLRSWRFPEISGGSSWSSPQNIAVDRG